MTDEATREDATVLVVEDETELADLYVDYLQGSYDVDVAYGGTEALELLGDEYDVVLLDRRMPVVSGNEVLATIENRDIDCRIAMVTAVNPDFDIIDLGVDDYLVKPVTREEMRDTVERLLKLREYDERTRELTRKRLKRNLLEVEKHRVELEQSEEFTRLTREIGRLEREVETIADELGPILER